MNLLDFSQFISSESRGKIKFKNKTKQNKKTVIYPGYTTTHWRRKEGSPFKNEWYKNSQ